MNKTYAFVVDIFKIQDSLSATLDGAISSLKNATIEFHDRVGKASKQE